MKQIILLLGLIAMISCREASVNVDTFTESRQAIQAFVVYRYSANRIPLPSESRQRVAFSGYRPDQQIRIFFNGQENFIRDKNESFSVKVYKASNSTGFGQKSTLSIKVGEQNHSFTQNMPDSIVILSPAPDIDPNHDVILKWRKTKDYDYFFVRVMPAKDTPPFLVDATYMTQDTLLTLPKEYFVRRKSTLISVAAINGASFVEAASVKGYFVSEAILEIIPGKFAAKTPLKAHSELQTVSSIETSVLPEGRFNFETDHNTGLK